MLTDPLDLLLTQREYASIRRCSERTIERERASGTGCRYIKIGRGVRYKRADLLDFIESHARRSTSELEPQP
jgi:helix-turn-helix protein